jgi:MFS family permease
MIAGCLTGFAADIYAPSLPGIAENLHARIEQVQFSMAVYLFGVALAQLIFGPLSEGLGRKGPWIMGTVIMFIGSLICYLAPTIEVLIAGRFIQGIGAGSSAVLWRVVFRDLFNKEQLAKMGSYGVIFVMFIIPAAPALGGFLDSTFNWRASFLFMLGYAGVVLLLLLFGYKETSKHHQRERLKLSYVGKTFLLMLTNRVFMGIAMSSFLTYGSFFSWFVVGPVLLVDVPMGGSCLSCGRLAEWQARYKVGHTRHDASWMGIANSSWSPALCRKNVDGPHPLVGAAPDHDAIFWLHVHLAECQCHSLCPFRAHCGICRRALRIFADGRRCGDGKLARVFAAREPAPFSPGDIGLFCLSLDRV